MRTPTRLAASILLIVVLIWALPAQARVPEPDHIFFGVARRTGVPITSGVVTVVTGSALAPIASFTLDGVTSNFVLRVPIDSLAPQDPGTARPGDTARIYVNGQLAATTTVGERGTATLIDLDESGATTTALASSSNPAPLGIGITLTATVAPAVAGAGQPTGSVTFRDGTTILATVPVDANSRARHTVAGLTLGLHEVVAEYGGGGIFGSSRSDSLQQVVLSQTATFIASSATTLRPGQPLTLTADVRSLSAGGGTPPGTVVFRDGATSLGAVPLSGAGQATLNLPSLDKGTHRLTAEYSGSPIFFPSRGGPITQGVTDAEVCSVASFAASSLVPVGTDPRSLASADWNGDGNADLAVANSASNTVTLLFGDGLGGFVPAGSAIPAGLAPQAIIAGDFDGDGKPDIAVAARDSNEVRVLLGDGLGNLASGAATALPSPRALVAADFNLDGRLDLAAASESGNTVTLLIGDGAGAFSSQTPSATGTLPTALAAGDLNGDGRPDLVVANATSGDVTVFLGDGLGGLSSVATVPAAAFPQAIAIADLNSDGKPDLVTVQSGSWDVHVLMGDGAGGYVEAAGSPFAAGSQPRGVAVGDFDLDGKLDIAVVSAVSGDVTILAGNGAFGFSPAATRPLGGAPFAVVVADFNNDGRPDLASANSGSHNVSIQLSNCTASTLTAIASSVTPSAFGQSVVFTVAVTAAAPASGLPTGTVSFTDGGSPIATGVLNAAGEAQLTTDALLPGTHSIAAVYQGDANFSGSSSLAFGQEVTKVGSTTTLAASPTATVVGQTVTLTATVHPLAPGLPALVGDVIFRDGAALIGVAPLSGSVATLTTNALAVGTHLLSADYGGSAHLLASTSAALPFVVSPHSTRTVCAVGCAQSRIQDAINASAPGDTILVTSTYDSIAAGEVFPIQTLAIRAQDPAGTITITGETDGSGNPSTTIRTKNITGLDGVIIVSPGTWSNLRIVPGDSTKPNRIIAAGSGNACPGPACHLQGGLTIQNVVIDFTVIDGTATPHFNTGNGLDLLADDVSIDKVTLKGIAGSSILVDGNNYIIQNSTLDGRDGNVIRGTLAIGFGADQKQGGVACSGFPTNYLINGNAIAGYGNGIQWCSGRNNTISNNAITDVSGKGIDSSGSQGTQVFGNVLQNSATGAIHGIGLSQGAFQGCSGNTVRNNKVLGRAARDMLRGIVVQSCVDTTIFQNEARDFADNGGAIEVTMAAGVATKTTIQGNTVIGGNGAGIVYLGSDSAATAVDQSVIRDNVVNEFKRNGIVVQGLKGVRSGAGAGNVVAYNTVRAVNQGNFGDTHAFNLQNLANTAFDRNTALDTRLGYGFYLANSTDVNGNCNTGSTNGAGLFGQMNVTPTYGNANVNCRVALYSHYDFDGDGRSDVTMYRHTTGEWFTKNSSDGADSVTAFGQGGSDDIPVPGNYTVAGKTDRAVYRYTTGEWYIRRATDGGTTLIPFGVPLTGDVPMPADYDGDGITDLAVFRTSTANAEWYIRRSSDGQIQYVAWGCAACADLAVPGDFDADGKADVAVYRRSTGNWFIRKSSDATLEQVAYGDVAQGDIPIPGRYTQTAKTEMAVYRSLTGDWLIRRATDFGTTSVNFGEPAAGDFPVPADFIQSGITDLAIYRPTPPTAQFMIRRLTDLGVLFIPYGNPGSQDAPLTAR